MLINTLVELFDRDLDRLKKELSAWRDESNLWYTAGDVKNSAGNLVLHLVGNLNHFIGAVLGDSGYIREREKEFSQKNIARSDLLEQVELTKKVVIDTLSALAPARLEKSYPLEVLGKKDMTTAFFLIHLSTHLNYHLGQMNYLRRLCD
jgi:uncharacterized damage-inducible protein DinB